MEESPNESVTRPFDLKMHTFAAGDLMHCVADAAPIHLRNLENSPLFRNLKKISQHPYHISSFFKSAGRRGNNEAASRFTIQVLRR